jgi:hypothetical protein
MCNERNENGENNGIKNNGVIIVIKACPAIQHNNGENVIMK